jgi:peroxiredoxin
MAPGFSLLHPLQAHLELHCLCGQPVFLVFYLVNWEPVSRAQLALFQDCAREFDRRRARLLGISIDHGLSTQPSRATPRSAFPLLADFRPRGAVAPQYGVYHEEEGVAARAVFVLDRQGLIRFSQAYPICSISGSTTS